MDRLEGLKEKQKGIDGRDAGAIMGVNKYKTAFQVYLEKTGEVTEDIQASEPAYWRNILADIVTKEFTLRTGKKVRKINKQLVHRDNEFMVCNTFRKIVGENSILVCKTTSVFNAKSWDLEEIPESYLLQCQHYLAVTEAEKCYIAVLIGGQKFIFKEILKDDELISMIIEAEKDFWINHVEKRNPPELDGSSAAEKYLKSKYPCGNSSMQKDLTSEYKDKIVQYLSLKDQIKCLEETFKALENVIKHELGEAERGVVGNYLVNWKSIVSNRIDSKKLKGSYPDVYKDVLNEIVSRRFDIKEVF